MTMIGRVTNHRREISKGQKAEHGNNEHALHSGGPQQETERKKLRGRRPPWKQWECHPPITTDPQDLGLGFQFKKREQEGDGDRESKRDVDGLRLKGTH